MAGLPGSESDGLHRQLSSISSKSVRSDSPTLDDLQKQYQLLQEKLAHDESTDNVDLQIVDSIEEEDKFRQNLKVVSHQVT
jgi:hypothetical protein